MIVDQFDKPALNGAPALTCLFNTANRASEAGQVLIGQAFGAVLITAPEP